MPKIIPLLPLQNRLAFCGLFDTEQINRHEAFTQQQLTPPAETSSVLV